MEFDQEDPTQGLTFQGKTEAEIPPPARPAPVVEDDDSDPTQGLTFGGPSPHAGMYEDPQILKKMAAQKNVGDAGKFVNGTSSTDKREKPAEALSFADKRRAEDGVERRRMLGSGRAIQTGAGAEGRLGALQRDPRMDREEEGSSTGAKIASKVAHAVPVLGSGMKIASGIKEMSNASAAGKVAAEHEDTVTASMASGLQKGHKQEGVKDLVGGTIGMATDIAGLATGGAAKLAGAPLVEGAKMIGGKLLGDTIGLNPIAPIEGMIDGAGEGIQGALGGAMGAMVGDDSPLKDKATDVATDKIADAAGERAGGESRPGRSKIANLSQDVEGAQALSRYLAKEEELGSTGDFLAAGREVTGSKVENASKLPKAHFWNKQQYNQIDKSENLKPSMMAALSKGEDARREQVEASGDAVQALHQPKSAWQK